MNVVEKGSGPPVVLLHGFGAASSTWRHQLDPLATEFLVVAPDLPGFGDSLPLEEPDAISYATALSRYFERRGLDDILLVGWSMGGVILLAYCEYFGSERLGGIGIVDVAPRARPAPDWPVADFGASVDRWLEQWPRGREPVFRELAELAFAEPRRHRLEIEWLVDDALRADPAAALGAFTSLLECDFRETLPRIDVPSLLLFGGRSRSTTPEVRSFMASSLRNGRLTVFEHCGHALMLEAPEQFTATVREFARSLP